MTEQMMLRLAMVLQDKAPATLNKNICRLSASVLSDSPVGLSVNEICSKIKACFNLDFTVEEVSDALKKKGQRQFVVRDGLYLLDNNATFSHGSDGGSYLESLDKLIWQFIEETGSPIRQDKLFELVKRYLYYCFNSSVSNIFDLLNKQNKTDDNASFEATNDEIIALNSFLAWNNTAKDSLIYHIVTTCIEYCMLTVKKDNAFSKDLFKGKRFFLDANIIFRMAGINNEERQFVTKSFEKHCTEAGIVLAFSTSTLEEITRVIDNQIEYIKGLSGTGFPINAYKLAQVNPSNEITDFYKRYYDWCSAPENKAGDYETFRRYLFGLVHETLFTLTSVNSSSYSSGPMSKSFEASVNSLMEFKNSFRKKWRQTTRSSAETDIANILDIRKKRSNSATSVWQTSDFLVSADQRLIEWASKVYVGVPIVVLPSVWLSMILRFTGRTSDDYKSFCLFLTQRQHKEDDSSIDPALLLKNINSKTNNIELKEKIISEIIENTSQYQFTKTCDYNSSVDKAFDAVMSDYSKEASAHLETVQTALQEKYDHDLLKAQKEEQTAREKACHTNQQNTVFKLSKHKAATKVAPFRWLNKNTWICYLVGAIFFAIGLLVMLYNQSAVCSWVGKLVSPSIMINANTFTIFFTILWALVSLFMSLIGKSIVSMLGKLGSTDREERLSRKYYEKNMQIIESEDDLAA